MADSYYQLAGTVSVPEEKREELNRKILHTMERSGIRKVEDSGRNSL